MEHEDAEQEQAGKHHDDGEVGFGMECLREEISAIHRDHQELAVGEVDDAHHPEGQGQPNADQAVDAAEQYAGDDRLQNEFGVHAKLREFARPHVYPAWEFKTDARRTVKPAMPNNAAAPA